MSINFLEEMANFTFASKYARYDEKRKRRETWEETVGRVEQMHLKKFKFLPKEEKAEIKKAFDFVREKKVVSSMRSMQFGGKAIEAHQTRGYNCGVRHIDSLRSFAESFYTLLCGTGVGFGISNRFLNRLPDLVNAKDKTGTVISYIVQDNIEGWADSVEALLTCYFKNTPYTGRKIVFDYSRIRPKGAKLKTGGGKAPGYKGLKNCHTKIKHLLDSIIEENGQVRLKTINAYDILMHCADAVLSGGIRRAATSVIFDYDDEEMMNAKTGNWFNENPQRARSNNSAIVLRGNTPLESFEKIIKRTKEFGEPGFLFVESSDQLLNPCQPKWATVLTPNGIRTLEDIKVGDKIWSESGWTKVVNKWSTGVKDVHAYRTTAGTFYGTENHPLISNGASVEAGICESIDTLQGDFVRSCIIDPSDVMDGLVIGDGASHKASNNLITLHIGENDHDYFKSEIAHLIIKHRPGISKTSFEVKTSLSKSGLPLPRTYERFVPDEFFYGSKGKVVGFLRGLYSANGSVCGNRVTLKAASFQIIEKVQILLSSLGIKSYYTTNQPINVQFSNGDYLCKRSYDLNISTDKDKFAKLIGFIQSYKNDKLELLLKDGDRREGKKNYDIVHSEYISTEEVFDITVDNESHTYWTGGLNVHNCFEISFLPVTLDGRAGFQFCNLSSINGAKISNQQDFENAAWAASLIGTLQAAYTSFPYLGHVAEELCKEEALLGVSITGMMDSPDVIFDPENQKKAAKVAVETNKEWAAKIGINQAARITCIKPEGTTSIILSSASGIHPHHSRKYFRRIQMNKEDNIFKFFKMHNPHACEESVWSANKTDEVVTFPVEISEKAIIKKDLTAIKHLELIKSTQLNWVNSGTTEANKKPLNHSVSCTVIVKDDEWEEVTKYLYDNQGLFTAVSLLPYSGDKIYKQAPMEDVVTEEDEQRFQELKKLWEKVDYTKLEEIDDETSLSQEVSCAGGKCEIV